MGTKPSIFTWIACIAFFALMISGCSDGSSGNIIIATPEGTYTVDPLFREFYDHLGGTAVLGPAISPLFSHEAQRYQYIQAGCLEFDANAPPAERFRLSALGKDMGISDPPEPAPTDPELVYINGHIIFKEFVSFYRSLGGAKYVGNPLTEVHFNPDKKRFEQYFEDLGFYWMESDPPGTIRLLAYGAWKCDVHCRHVSPASTIVDLPSVNYQASDRLFEEVVKSLGTDMAGFPLVEPYLAPDGKYEQIFENIVVSIDARVKGPLKLRPIAELLGIQIEPLVLPSGIPGMSFWAIDGERGHNIPQEFVDYITRHGGIDISGPPITELFLVDNQIFRQCFRNLCLDYHLNENIPQGLRIRPAPLGRQYKEIYYQPLNMSFIETQSLQSINMQVWEHHTFISSSQEQEIGAAVYQDETPLANIEPVLTVYLPDGKEDTYYFPPTGKDGKSEVKIPPILAANGTIIVYKVCVENLNKERYCVKDAYLIWFNP
jgi:hypothetical protein